MPRVRHKGKKRPSDLAVGFPGNEQPVSEQAVPITLSTSSSPIKNGREEITGTGNGGKR